MERLEAADQKTDAHSSSFRRPVVVYLRELPTFLNLIGFHDRGVEFLQVDGSQGEGGGQILRTAVFFSVVQNRPIVVSNIRAGRKEPGLKRQHVSALGVLAQVFGGVLTGAVEGSSEVRFAPGDSRADDLTVDMKTAASITLVLQAVVPAAAIKGRELSLHLTGGTDVPWSPTFDYFAIVAREAYARIGIEFKASDSRRGFYPRGGGRATAKVLPCQAIQPLDMIARSNIEEGRVISRCSRLSVRVAERQYSAAASVLSEGGLNPLAHEVVEDEADSPGSSILIYHSEVDALLGSDGLGARGKPAESVGKEAAERFVGAVRSGATLDSNIADMVLPLLSMADRPSRVAVPEVSSHLQTGLGLAKQFTGCEYSISKDGERWLVSVTPGRGN
jgi:RNA 3'-phosphate cyclase